MDAFDKVFIGVLIFIVTIFLVVFGFLGWAGYELVTWVVSK